LIGKQTNERKKQNERTRTGRNLRPAPYSYNATEPALYRLVEPMNGNNEPSEYESLRDFLLRFTEMYDCDGDKDAEDLARYVNTLVQKHDNVRKFWKFQT